VDRSHARPFISATPLPHATGGPLDQDELIVTEQTDFSSFLFCNPVNIYVIITVATGGRTGLPVDAEQLKFSS